MKEVFGGLGIRGGVAYGWDYGPARASVESPAGAAPAPRRPCAGPDARRAGRPCAAGGAGVPVTLRYAALRKSHGGVANLARRRFNVPVSAVVNDWMARASSNLACSIRGLTVRRPTAVMATRVQR